MSALTQVPRVIRFLDEKLPDRFWSRCAPEPNSGCWLWFGTALCGYGQFWLKPQNRYAHRVAYEALVGPIGNGLQIDHLCRTPMCVNPAHLEPVTSVENMRRARRRCKQGHEPTAENSYFRPDNGARQCRLCNLENRRRLHRKHGRKPRRKHADTFNGTKGAT